MHIPPFTHSRASNTLRTKVSLLQITNPSEAKGGGEGGGIHYLPPTPLTVNKNLAEKDLIYTLSFLNMTFLFLCNELTQEQGEYLARHHGVSNTIYPCLLINI